MSSMAYEVTMDTSYEQALPRVIDALKEEGFGVLTRIDVHDAFKEKLQGAAGGQFGSGWGWLAVDGSGGFFVIGHGRRRIVHFNRTGERWCGSWTRPP